MGKQQDREKIVQEIKVAADLYRKHLVGKRFLYVFEGRYIEVLYKAANFRHLTGVATNLSAKKFYSYAANANYAQTECQFRYCGTAIPFLTVRSTAR